MELLEFQESGLLDLIISLYFLTPPFFFLILVVHIVKYAKMPRLTRVKENSTEAILLRSKVERNQLNLITQLFNVGFIFEHTSVQGLSYLPLALYIIFIFKLSF